MAKKKTVTAPDPIRSDDLDDPLDVYSSNAVARLGVSDNTELVDDLSEEEKKQLNACENDLEKGMNIVGFALATIRNGRLYRATHKTFEEYVKDKFGLQRRRAHQLIGASEIVERIRQIDLAVADSGSESESPNLLEFRLIGINLF